MGSDWQTWTTKENVAELLQCLEGITYIEWQRICDSINQLYRNKARANEIRLNLANSDHELLYRIMDSKFIELTD